MSGYPTEGSPLIAGAGGPQPSSEKMYPPPGQYPIADQPPPYTLPQGMPTQGPPPGYQTQDYPPQGYPPQGYPPQGYPPQGYPPQGYPPQGYPPQGYPPQGYPPQSYPQQNVPPQGIPIQPGTVLIQPSVVVGNTAHYEETPVNVICPYCHSNIITSMEYITGTLSWLLVCILFFIGCWPFCLIPFCVDGCKDVTHRCPACQKVLGYFNRL